MENKFKCSVCGCRGHYIKQIIENENILLFYVCDNCKHEHFFKKTINIDLELAKLSKQAGFKYLYKIHLSKKGKFFMVVEIDHIINLKKFPNANLIDKEYYKLYKNKPMWKNLTSYSHYFSEIVDLLNN